ncbi:MAG TPA: DNA polymerase Y family protein [Terriglobales bacterium]|nr:DNA polymerase Y family protein [Terriglobales bacterium]
MAFACIFVPDFPVEAVLRAEPELRARAVAVLEGKPPLQKIFAVNEKARRTGIEPGMTKIQVEACSSLVLRARAPLQEAAAHAALLDCAQSFSPRVEDTAPDIILLDLSGLESLFGPPSRIARDIARRVTELGMEVNVAAASNPDTAQLAARGFSGVTVVPEGEETERLGSLALEVLFSALKSTDPSPYSEPLLQTFDRWGVRNLRALCALPEIALSERLGQLGVRLQQLARGGTSRTLVPAEPPLVFEEAMDLEYPLVLLEPLAFLLARMLDRLCARLGSCALAAQELCLQLELDSGYFGTGEFPAPENISDDGGTGILAHPNRAQQLFSGPEPDLHPGETPATARLGTNAPGCPGPASARQFTRTVRLPVPMLDAKVFLKLLLLNLKTHPPGAPIVKVRLAAEPARPRAAQAGLFLPPAPEPEKLELTRARIARMVGEEKVGSAELLDTHRPRSFRMQRFVPATSSEIRRAVRKDVKEEPTNGHLADAPLTALRLFRPPWRATVTLHNGQPVHLVCLQHQEVHGEIVWCAGPWRSSGDWWEQDGWSRDEWDIALPNNHTLALYRLVHDLLSERWFVEGTYD